MRAGSYGRSSSDRALPYYSSFLSNRVKSQIFTVLSKLAEASEGDGSLCKYAYGGRVRFNVGLETP